MSLFNNHSAETLILLFFIITYFLSVLEKLADWKGTVSYYSNHFKGTILQKMMPLLLINVVVFEIATLIFLLFGIYYLVTESSMLFAKIGLEFSAITLLLFLFAQRLVKDYPGAMNVTVYFILTVFGIYLLS